MKIIEVTDKATRKLFHKVPHLIYKGDSNWICPLEGEVEAAFDPGKNPYVRKGGITRWVLQDLNGNLLGRIAAFYNRDKANTFEQPTGGCGYFECINDKEAAFALFDNARDWLKTQGMEAMDGPVNPGENYMNWGLLVNGFMPQGYGMPYNKEYYLDLYGSYGFKIYFEQYSYHLDLKKEFPARFWKIAEWVAKKPQFNFLHFDWKEKERFIDDFCRIYDDAWRFHEHFKPLDKKEINDFLSGAKPILDEEMIWFAYHEGRPIALFVMVPDVNQILRHLKGKLDIVGTLKFLYHKMRNNMTRTRILIMGIVPQFQKSGVESAIFWHLNKVMKRKPWYTEIEMSWAGDFNPQIISVYKAVGGEHMKTHYTLRYLFDRDKPFERAPIIQRTEN